MIGSIFSKKKNFEGLLSSTDLHSHLLPGIDDGVQSIEESLEVIKGFVNLGFKKLVTTPHDQQFLRIITGNDISSIRQDALQH